MDSRRHAPPTPPADTQRHHRPRPGSGTGARLFAPLLVGLTVAGLAGCRDAIAAPSEASAAVVTEAPMEPAASRIIISRIFHGQPLTNELEVAERLGFQCEPLTDYAADIPVSVHACVRPTAGGDARLLTGAFQFGSLEAEVAEARDQGWKCNQIAGFDAVQGPETLGLGSDPNMHVTVPHQAFACSRALR